MSLSYAAGFAGARLLPALGGLAAAGLRSAGLLGSLGLGPSRVPAPSSAPVRGLLWSVEREKVRHSVGVA